MPCILWRQPVFAFEVIIISRSKIIANLFTAFVAAEERQNDDDLPALAAFPNGGGVIHREQGSRGQQSSGGTLLIYKGHKPWKPLTRARTFGVRTAHLEENGELERERLPGERFYYSKCKKDGEERRRKKENGRKRPTCHLVKIIIFFQNFIAVPLKPARRMSSLSEPLDDTANEGSGEEEGALEVVPSADYAGQNDDSTDYRVGGWAGERKGK